MNILSYIGMNLQSEVCLWTLLGLIRTIFDATLFKVNANLKQVWQMSMPPQLSSLPVQRFLRTMVSGVMLVQCFTVYVYLASYIVLLYPVFLEERPALVLPWLLLAAIRKLLCELTSLALGLGTCVLLGPARPSCVKFLVSKIFTIMPAFYMWTLVFSYYHSLKMAAAFKTFPVNLPVSNDQDCGIELAVRRRRTKSLLGEDQLRRKLIASFYGERPSTELNASYQKIENSIAKLTNLSMDEITGPLESFQPVSVTSNRTMSDIGTYEDWFGSEVVVPRDTDRILEQFVLMLLRIGVYLKKENADSTKLFNTNSMSVLPQQDTLQCNPISNEDAETPPLVGSSRARIQSYLRDYPNIFMKKPSDLLPETQIDQNMESNDTDHNNGKPDSLSASISLNKSTQDISLDTKESYEIKSTHVNEQIKESYEMSNRTDPYLQNKDDEKDEMHGNLLKQDSNESIKSVIERIKNRVNFSQTSSKDSQVSANSSVSRYSTNNQSSKKMKKPRNSQRKHKEN
ncbi:uncharacterized protein LOC119832601 [Zerene cesonia]|uniref:uncharacterized protein LOC119832601 n=1 Tax=Zerene cesonia TaxID=33412 RepID=UPI0018E54764|nr:uncharacterized protein LOC119832601 [Zerene cesonia]